MAYSRFHLAPPKSTMDYEVIDVSSSKTTNLTIFSIDISRLTASVQYMLLAGGLIFFMCLYGYFQELVVYGWFDRKLSIFSTFLHFLGCAFFAQMQRRFSSSGISGNNANNSGPGNSDAHGRVLSMGTAPRMLALGYYFLLVFLKTATQGLTNLSMTQINYPAKVLFKSANPIITMFLGVTWFRKAYPPRDYLVVALLVFGLYIFVNSDHSASPEGTRLGIFLVTMSMFGSASVPMVQEFVMQKYGATVEELLYHSYVGSTGLSLLMAVVTGEFTQGLYFLAAQSTVSTWISFTLFCSVGFVGANFSTLLTQRFGSLVNGVTNTARKAVTLCLSFIMFPERNKLTIHHIIGACIFFCGLVLRSVLKDRSNIGVTMSYGSNSDDKASPHVPVDNINIINNNSNYSPNIHKRWSLPSAQSPNDLEHGSVNSNSNSNRDDKHRQSLSPPTAAAFSTLEPIGERDRDGWDDSRLTRLGSLSSVSDEKYLARNFSDVNHVGFNGGSSNIGGGDRGDGERELSRSLQNQQQHQRAISLTQTGTRDGHSNGLSRAGDVGSGVAASSTSSLISRTMRV